MLARYFAGGISLAITLLSATATANEWVYDKAQNRVFNTQTNQTFHVHGEQGSLNFIQTKDEFGNKVYLQPQVNQTVAGRYLVELESPSVFKLKQNLTSAQLTAQATTTAIERHQTELQAQQASVIQSIGRIDRSAVVLKQHQKLVNMMVIEIDDSRVAEITKLPQVKKVWPSRVMRKSLAESVPLINAPLVWELEDSEGNLIQGDGIDVAIVDTGIDYTHPDLGGCLGEECKVVAGYDFVNEDNDPMDGDGHGTHVAGIVAGVGEGYTGVAPNVRLHAYKVLDDNGSGFDSDIIQALEYAIDPDGDPSTDDRVDVLNMSLGGGGDANDLLSQATDAAVAAGIVVVVAAGNSGNYGDIPVTSPASARDAITVASSTKEDTLSYFSSKGPMNDEGYLKPEVTAPGSDISAPYLNHGISSLSGTSMASPHVAGVAALMKQLHPEWTPSDIKKRLMAGTVDLGLDPFSQGTGRVDAPAAVNAEIVAPQGALDFGRIDNDLESWEVTKTLTIENLAEEARTVNFEMPMSLPVELLVTTDIDTSVGVEIPAGGSVDVEITLSVVDVANFPFPDNEIGAFFDNLVISTDTQSLRVPLLLSRAITLSVTHDFDNWPFLYLVKDEGSYRRIQIERSGETEIVVAPGEYQVSLDYGLMSVADTSISDLDPDMEVWGFDIQHWSVFEDTNIHLTPSLITHAAAMGEVKDYLGNEVPDERLFDGFASINVALGDTFSSGHIFFGFRRLSAGIGTLFEDTEFSYAMMHAFSVPNSEIDANHVAAVRTNVNPDQVQNYILDVDTTLSDDPEQNKGVFLDYESEIPNTSMRVGITGESSSIATGFGDSQTAIVAGFNISGSETSGAFLGAYAPDNFDSTNDVYSTGVFRFDEQGHIIKKDHVFLPELNLQTKLINPTPQGSYFNRGIEVHDGKIDVYHGYDFEGNQWVTDLHRNRFGRGAGSVMELNCGTEILEYGFGDIFENLELSIPEDCAAESVSVSFDNTLNGQDYRSDVTLQLVEAPVWASTIDAIRMVEGTAEVTDQLVNRIDPYLEITSFAYYSDSMKVEAKVGEDDYVELPYEVTEDSRVYIHALPMMPGEHVLSLRISFIEGAGNTVTHTLNGFALIGADAGGESDVDGDGIDNATDTDDDNDGVNDDVDVFPYNSREWEDTDGDGIGNNADTDDDNDGYLDEEDAFPLDASEWADFDMDGIGDNADPDDDNDGYNDDVDVFPYDGSEWEDTDGDSVGNNADTDDDNDGVEDSADAFPLNAAEWEDTDSDGIGNNEDTDDDNDGVADTNDAYPLDPNRSEVPSPTPPSNDSGGGGSTGLMVLLLLPVLLVRKKKRH